MKSLNLSNKEFLTMAGRQRGRFDHPKAFPLVFPYFFPSLGVREAWRGSRSLNLVDGFGVAG